MTAMLRRWWPLLAAMAWIAATAWMRPLALPDEGRYVGVAWEMLRSGDWLVPRLDGLPYFHKPPLFYWITAASLQLFGQHEWAARLAPLLGGALALAALNAFARRWWGEPTARIALAVLATQPLFFFGAQFANLDMLVAGCIAACILALAHAALAPRPARAVLAAAYVFAALGVLAKGLIGAVLPALVVGLWLLPFGRWRALLRLLWLPGVALFLAVAAPWFVAMQQRFPDFLHYFFVVQHFTRFAGSGFNNVQPFWFFLVVLAVGTLPWSVWALRSRAGTGVQQDDTQRALRRLLWTWIAVVTLFFSLPQSKLVGYILPATPPVALLAALALARARDARQGMARVPRFPRFAAGTMALLCVAAAVALALMPQKSNRALGLELARRLEAGDRVVFLRGYPFDLPFYARLAAPVPVVDGWQPVAGGPDNWHKELADAGRFAPELAARLLVAEPPLAPCALGALWLVGSAADRERFALLQGAQAVARQGQTVLWRVEPLSAQACARTPTPSSADR